MSFDNQYTSYAKFTPLSPTPTELLKNSLEAKDTFQKIQTMIEGLGKVTKIQSDYFNVSSYYYNQSSDTIYEINNITAQLKKPQNDVDNHLRIINGLPRHD